MPWFISLLLSLLVLVSLSCTSSEEAAKSGAEAGALDAGRWMHAIYRPLSGVLDQKGKDTFELHEGPHYILDSCLAMQQLHPTLSSLRAAAKLLCVQAKIGSRLAGAEFVVSGMGKVVMRPAINGPSNDLNVCIDGKAKMQFREAIDGAGRVDGEFYLYQFNNGNAAHFIEGRLAHHKNWRLGDSNGVEQFSLLGGVDGANGNSRIRYGYRHADSSAPDYLGISGTANLAGKKQSFASAARLDPSANLGIYYYHDRYEKFGGRNYINLKGDFILEGGKAETTPEFRAGSRLYVTPKDLPKAPSLTYGGPDSLEFSCSLDGVIEVDDAIAECEAELTTYKNPECPGNKLYLSTPADDFQDSETTSNMDNLIFPL